MPGLAFFIDRAVLDSLLHRRLSRLFLCDTLTLSSRSPSQMSSTQSQQIKQNFLNHPYTQQANKFVNGQVSALDAEVRLSSRTVVQDL